LTAGIAHEIQNPLNFVNNFSELNKELIEELSQHARDGNLKEIRKLASDIKANEDKIEQHGKRADAIVKSMLQHSRVSSGKKELTDINALCEEYSRLAYHGYRAKDKSFNAKLETDFDQQISPIQAISPDIGRVILNLVNNAFYEVTEKNKLPSDDYTPIVTVLTKKVSNKIEICVKDNGRGIPEQARDKIFQPFFTTKPAGQGTGLGLSLSYDIIKAHGGTLGINSTEGKGSEFIILLPI
jgi:signal transduction histidine kinase